MLRIGPGLKPYWVPEVLLQSLKDLPRGNSDDESIHLQDVDVETGHVIAHFLYTGRYHLLPIDPAYVDGTEQDKLKEEFEKAIAVFVTAKKYRLTGLQELAKDQTERIADKISMMQAAHAVTEGTLAILQEDAAWLYTLVLQKADKAFEEDHALFSSASLYDGIKSLTLAKLLGQHVADLYCRQIFRLNESLNSTLEVTNGKDIHNSQDPLEAGANQPVEALSAGVICATQSGVRAQSEQVLVTTEDQEPGLYPTAKTPTPQPSENAREDVSAERSAINRNGDVSHGNTAVMTEAALIAHYAARTGPFKGLKKSERMLLRKQLRAQAVAKSDDTEGDIVPEVTERQEHVDIVATVPVVDGIVVADPFVGLSKLQKKKLEKRLQEEAAARELQESTNAKFSPEGETPTDSCSILRESDSAVGLNPSDDEYCAFRYEHLSQIGRWRECKQCEEYMRRIAIKLHSAGMPDVNMLITT